MHVQLTQYLAFQVLKELRSQLHKENFGTVIFFPGSVFKKKKKKIQEYFKKEEKSQCVNMLQCSVYISSIFKSVLTKPR